MRSKLPCWLYCDSSNLKRQTQPNYFTCFVFAFIRKIYSTQTLISFPLFLLYKLYKSTKWGINTRGFKFLQIQILFLQCFHGLLNYSLSNQNFIQFTNYNVFIFKLLIISFVSGCLNKISNRSFRYSLSLLLTEHWISFCKSHRQFIKSETSYMWPTSP